MGLKRYVLLNDNRVVEIYKKEKFGYSYIDKEINGIVFTRSILISDVKKTSDNILDLFDVGDLVELSYIEGVFYIQDLKPFYVIGMVMAVDKEEVIAIYKRQTNGDYKRYEVKE